LREVIDFLKRNKILLSNNSFQNSLNKLTQKIEKYFLKDYDAPSYISEETIFKIETLINQDIKEQTETYIDEFFKDTFTDYHHEYIDGELVSKTKITKNGKLILDRYNKKKIEEKLKKDIISNCEDRLIYDLFVEDKQDNTVKTPILKNIPEVSSDSKVDEIDELFDRS